MTQYRDFEVTVFMEYNVVKTCVLTDSDAVHHLLDQIEDDVSDGRPAVIYFSGGGATELILSHRIISIAVKPALEGHRGR